MEEIKKTVKTFFFLIDPDIRVDIFLEEENALHVKARMRDAQVLIGEKGRTLAEIERLLKIIIRKKSEGPLFINLDINDYKKRKADYLRDLAKETAEEVAHTGIEKKFPPMSSFERRIIHKTLSEREDVTTQSIGEGEERKVLIRKNRSY